METKTDRLFIIIPAYNERENIRQVLDDWYPVIQAHSGNGESRLVVIDDGSKDDTYIIMQEYAKEHPLFSPITKTNSGHGATVLYGYHYALDHGADFVFQTDSDGQTLPSEFEQFWNQREAWDMVIGWRNNRQDGGQSYLCYSYSTPCDSYLFRCFRQRCQHAIPSEEGRYSTADILT